MVRFCILPFHSGFAVLAGSDAFIFFEDTDKIFIAVISNLHGNVPDICGSFCQKTFGLINPESAQIINKADVGSLFYGFEYINGRNMKMLGQIGQRHVIAAEIFLNIKDNAFA